MYEVNQKTLAEALNISAREIRNLKQRGMFPFIPGTKKYDLAGCVSEYIEFKIKAETGRGASIDREREQAEHERLKKEVTKIKLRKLRGEVHEAADVEAFLNNTFSGFRSCLLAVPAKIAPLILNKCDINEIMELLTREMSAVLDALSQYDPDKINKNGDIDFDSEEDDEDDLTYESEKEL